MNQIVGHCPSCGSPIYGPDHYEHTGNHTYTLCAYTCFCRHHTKTQTPNNLSGALFFFTFVFGTISIVALTHWW